MAMKSKNRILLSFCLLKEVTHVSPARLWLEGMGVLASPWSRTPEPGSQKPLRPCAIQTS